MRWQPRLTEILSYTLPAPLTGAVSVLLALVEDIPVDMAVPDVDDASGISPDAAIARVRLEDGEGGFIVSRTRVLGVLDPLRLAETSNGMITDGIEVMVLVISASVRVATAVDGPMVMAAPLLVVGMSIPNIASVGVTPAKHVRARRKTRKAITAEGYYSLIERCPSVDIRVLLSGVGCWLIDD